ncbi:Uncharacterized protein HZ326_27534, partial [Fusarium oxysporum f. sp. albedinis]
MMECLGMHRSSELPSKQTAFATQPPIIPAYQSLLKPLHAAENEKDKKRKMLPWPLIQPKADFTSVLNFSESDWSRFCMASR